MKNFLIKDFLLKSFVILILSILDACAMSESFELNHDQNTQTTKIIKSITPPVSVPFDLTKKGNKTELVLKIKEYKSYSFELEFFYDDPRASKYEWVEFIRSFFPNKKYSDEEYMEIMKDYERVQKLVGYQETIIIKENNVNKIKDINHEGIYTPIHLTIKKIIENDNEKLIFDKTITDLEKARPGSKFYKRIEWIILSPGTYKIVAESMKDSPELINVKTHLWINGWFAK